MSELLYAANRRLETHSSRTSRKRQAAKQKNSSTAATQALSVALKNIGHTCVRRIAVRKQ